MAYANALSAYKQTKVKTAGQGQLIIMLYDEAVKQLDRGLDLLKSYAKGKKDPGKIEDIAKALLKAQEIITELQASLDFEHGGDIAKHLFALYSWFNQEIVASNVKKDIQRVANVRAMLADLRSAWSEAILKAGVSNETAGTAVRGVNIAG
ncbi:MAG: flagellar export chaperone FliS [Spirochaetaceae bacterium]|nr:flagellar export chaperone FliS [Spirochaetaceae bacterium]